MQRNLAPDLARLSNVLRDVTSKLMFFWGHPVGIGLGA
jgi:hypothetical protein